MQRSRVGVEVRDNDVEKALSVFNRRVKKSGILYEHIQNQQFTKPSKKRRDARKQKERRIKRKNKNSRY
jgi:ribosomal protein S21